MQKISYLLLYYFITELIQGAIIPCSNESSTKFAHVEIVGTTKTVFCHDDDADLSSYEYTKNITLHDKSLMIAGATNIFYCHVSCTGCYGSTENDCLTCSSSTRGTTQMFPSFTQFVSVTPYSCPCRANFIENNTVDCQCPNGFYTKLSTTIDSKSCETCPTQFSFCEYDYATASIIEIICKKPCATCISGTASECTSCYDPNAILGNEKCPCKERFYLSLTDLTCIACYKTCKTCNGPLINQCLSCIDTDMNLINQECICKYGFYPSPSGVYCFYCHATCQSCKGGYDYDCLSCDPLTQRILQSGYCKCPQYFVTSLVRICVRCDTSCLTCNDQNSCVDCIQGSNRQILNPGDLCTCVPGYAENPSNPFCVTCHYSCLTCQDIYSICTSCPIGSLRELINNECLCPSKYFDDGNQICQLCNQNCLTCDGNNIDNCITCDSVNNRVLNDQRQCVCQKGYGYIDLNTELCQVCNNFCQTCDQVNSCLTCDISLHRMLQDPGICPCDDGYFESNLQCVKCHITCKSCFGADQNSCLNCDLDGGREIQNNQCQCSEGYFNNYNNECKQCFYACVSCVNEFFNGCIKCDASRTLTSSQCICPIPQIDDGINNNCQSCHYSCQTCNGIYYNNCLTCQENSLISTITRVLQYSQCICPPRWFDDQVNENCKQCHKSCFTCFNTDQYSCISCSDIDHRSQQSNSCYCKDGYLEAQNSCAKCDYRCLTCSQDITNCLACPVGSSRNLEPQTINTQYNTCACAPGAGSDLQDNPVCQTCHYSCQTCIGSAINQCTSCDKNLNRYLVSNSCECSQGYYVNAAECSSCSIYCLDCLTNPSTCISCNPKYFRELKVNECICGIRFGTQVLSYYDVGDTMCSACHYTCYTCNGSSYQQCLSCDSVKEYRQLINSQCKCMTGYLDYGSNDCQKCDERCLTCGFQINQCTSCPVGSLRVLNIQAQSCDCPYGYYDPGTSLCLICDAVCETCSDRATKCLSCKAGQNRIYNQLVFSCDCLVGYYDLGNGSCNICNFSCTSCSGPLKTDCISCPDYKSTLRIFNSNQCLCQDQYFDDLQNVLCKPCSPTCYTCKETQNNCIICQSGQNRILEGNQCKCILGYFESGNTICDQCSQNCQECQINRNQCTKCEANRILNTGTCICKTGYFDDGTLACKQCDLTCQTCQNVSKFCTTCDSTKFRNLQSNKCICLSGLMDVGLPQCQPCDLRCKTCQNLITQCTTCEGSQNRILQASTCPCKDGYFENNIFQCQQCDSSCLTCQVSATFCLSCPSLTKINSLGQCKCQDGTFSDTNGLCQSCSYKCLTCQTTSNTCSTCNFDRNLVLNNCICLAGSYDSGISACQKCAYQCTTCSTTANNCLTCSLISQRKLSGSNCVCLQGYYDAGSLICAKCNYACLTCAIIQSNCTSCDGGLNRVQTGNQCNCSTGYFDDGAICQPCHYSCLTCSQQSTKCTSCDIALSFRNDRSTNFSQCPCQKGFFDDGTKICKQCAYNCIDCALNPTNCTICNNNPAFSRINLIPSCVCQDGYYDDGIQPICLKCSIGCQTCITNPTNCLICESPITRKTSPQCDCKDGFYLNSSQKCFQCAIKCLTCITNQYNCLTCQPDRITTSCVCQDGFYEANLLLCQECSPKCTTCENDKLNCLSCKPDRITPPNCVCKHHYYDNFVNIECQECDQYCGSCDNNGCIDCAANRLQSAKTCICPANSVSYTDTPWCSTCTVAVVKGIFSDDLSTILYKFEYPLLFNFPHKVDIQAQCQYILSNKSILLLGQSPQCTIDNNTLQIQLGDGSTVLVSNEIEFIPTMFKHINCDSSLIQIFRTTINPPLNLLKPAVGLSYPQWASPCSQIEIRLSSQNISGERNLQIQWLSQIPLSQIQLANQEQLQSLVIESGELPENTQINISLYFTNFLNQSDQVSINFTTLSYLTPQFNFITMRTQFIQWAPIKLIIFYNNDICKGIKKTSNEIKIDFSEKIETRTPDAKPIQFQQSSFILTDSQAMVSAMIPARTLTYNSNYTIIATYQDISTNKILQQQLEIYIIKSPIIVQIVDGTRIQNYLKVLTILIQVKDPDSQTQWNTDKNINLEVTCQDAQTQQPCQVDNKALRLNSTYRQDIAPRSFDPFSVVVFKVTATKGLMSSSDSATIIFLDAELPPLNIQYPQGYKLRDVNINEKVQFQALQSSKDIQYSYALVYDYEIVYITNVPDSLIKFAIWDNFLKFNFINTISVRILAHDIKYLMPQACSIQLSVNMPPINSLISINPQLGNAFFTNFSFRVTNSRDSDTPIAYRFAYYQSQASFDSDINKGAIDNLIILQDFSSIQSYQGLLESGDLIILVSVSDSLGSTINYTQKVRSQGFYDSQQLETDNSSVCVNFTLLLSNTTYSPQQLLILTQEFIKLYQTNITSDCKQKISQILLEYQEQLFAQIGQSTVIIASRIQNIISQIYSLKLKSTRTLNEQQQDICYNTTSQYVQFPYLNLLSDQNDSQAFIDKVSQISKQVEKSIQSNIQYISDYSTTLDFGDDQNYRNIQQNLVQRKGQIRLLSELYSQAFQQKLIIRNYINLILNSFQLNLEVDQQGIKIKQGNVGVYINKLSQTKYDSFIVPDKADPEFQDLFLNRFVQVSKYPSNFNLQNLSQILQQKKTSQFEYEQTLISFQMTLYDPFIFVEIGNTTNRVDRIYQGRLNYNIDYQFKPCNSSNISLTHNSNYSLICSNYRNNQWMINECETSIQPNKYGNIVYSCLCNYINPITLMMINTTNNTITQEKAQAKNRLEELIDLSMSNYNISLIIISIFLILLIVTRITKNKSIILSEIREKYNQWMQNHEIGLTQKPLMSTALLKQNIKYLHQVTRIFNVHYTHISALEQILILTFNVNVLITVLNLFNNVLNQSYLPIPAAFFVTLIFQIVGKILEGFFTGPYVLKVIGYILLVILNLGFLFANIIINMQYTDQTMYLVVLFGLIIIIYGPIEVFVQFMKLKLAFQICILLYEEPLNPVLNLAYYFVQDEVILLIVKGGQIDQQYN